MGTRIASVLSCACLALLCLSCEKTNITQGVRYLRPVDVGATARIPLAESEAAIVLTLNDPAPSYPYASQAILAQVTHSLGTGAKYAWYLNGEPLAGASSASLDLSASLGKLDTGAWELAVAVSSNGFSYVARAPFRVVD